MPARNGKSAGKRGREPVVEWSTPFERFVIEFLRAGGGEVERLGPKVWRARFDKGLSKKLRRRTAQLVFDPERATLPRGAVFVAPGSRFGLALLAAARGEGHVQRVRLEPAPDVDAARLAASGYILHGAEAGAPEVGEARWVAQVVFHFTLTLRGGVAEQDLRAATAEPQGPSFEFLESEERRGWRTRPGFPDEPVAWEEIDAREGVPADRARALWDAFHDWLQEAQATRLERWRRRCEEGRDRDLARVNDFYEARLREEEERRRRRREDPEDEEKASAAQLKLEWGRRQRAIRARWEPGAALDLWGIEEIARPRVPVRWTLETPEGPVSLAGEVDLAEGALTRLPCTVCQRLAREFWWKGGLVCRRCRARAGRTGGRRGRRPRATAAT